jgi:hypothetical protein
VRALRICEAWIEQCPLYWQHFQEHLRNAHLQVPP